MENMSQQEFNIFDMIENHMIKISKYMQQHGIYIGMFNNFDFIINYQNKPLKLWKI